MKVMPSPSSDTFHLTKSSNIYFWPSSAYLELAYNWTGLLVEPNPDMLRLLYAKHRKSWIFPHCLSPSSHVEIVNFDVASYLSGIILPGKIKPSLNQRDLQEIPINDFEREIPMMCFPFYSVLKALGNPSIDYFSLDIEGAEYAVLKSIPWKSVNITILGVEVNHAGDIFQGSRQDIFDLLESNEFLYVGKRKVDDFYVHKKYVEKFQGKI